MLLTDEIGGEVYSFGDVRLDKPSITVRELIAVRVDLELEAQGAAKADRRGDEASDVSDREIQLNGADKALRPSFFRACRNGETVARDRMVEVAVQGFLRNRFFVLLDRRQAEHLDDRVYLDRTGEVIFLHLTQLQGG